MELKLKFDAILKVKITTLIEQAQSNIIMLRNKDDEAKSTALAKIKDATTFEEVSNIMRKVTSHASLIDQFEEDIAYLMAVQDSKGGVFHVNLTKEDWNHYFRLQQRKEWC